jgi:hypothetical protein
LYPAWVLRAAQQINNLLIQRHQWDANQWDVTPGIDALQTIITAEYRRPETVEPKDDCYTEAELDRCKDWVGKAAQRVQELMQESKGVLPEGIIQSAIRVQYWAWSGEDEPQTYPHNHWTNQAARQIHTALLDTDVLVTFERMRCWIRDHYLVTMPGAEIEDDESCPDWDWDDWDPNAWDVRATVELHGLMQRGVPLTRDDIRFIIIEEYNADDDENPADFNIVEPIEHMDLESGAGTTVNIHAPVDVANFVMGPGSTINIFEPIAEVAIEQENGGTVWFMATPSTSHVQQGPGSLTIYDTLGCPGCEGTDDCEGCSGVAGSNSC